MSPVSKALVTSGVVLIILGVSYQFFGRWLPLGRLPGDIVVEKENVRLYFPIVTCVIISVILSLIGYIFHFIK
jgi:hypothetical protein